MFRFLLICLTFFLMTGTSFSKYKNRTKEIQKEVNFYFHKFKNRNTAVRISALRKITRINHKLTLKPLMYALDDKSTFIRRIAIKRLGEMEYTEVVPHLIRILKVEKELFVQKELINALGNLKDFRATDILKRYSEHSSMTLKVAAKKGFIILKSLTTSFNYNK